MADQLKTYEYEVNGIAHTAQLSAEDADRYNAKPVRSAKAPATKAKAAPENKAL